MLHLLGLSTHVLVSYTEFRPDWTKEVQNRLEINLRFHVRLPLRRFSRNSALIYVFNWRPTSNFAEIGQEILTIRAEIIVNINIFMADQKQLENAEYFSNICAAS